MSRSYSMVLLSDAISQQLRHFVPALLALCVVSVEWASSATRLPLTLSFNELEEPSTLPLTPQSAMSTQRVLTATVLSCCVTWLKDKCTWQRQTWPHSPLPLLGTTACQPPLPIIMRWTIQKWQCMTKQQSCPDTLLFTNMRVRNYCFNSICENCTYYYWRVRRDFHPEKLHGWKLLVSGQIFYCDHGDSEINGGLVAGR